MCHPTIKLSIVFEFGIETHDRAWCSINIFIDWESLKNQQNSLISSFFGAKLKEWQEADLSLHKSATSEAAPAIASRGVTGASVCAKKPVETLKRIFITSRSQALLVRM